MEDIAKGNIASVLNTTTTFLENCMSQGKNVSPFSHSKAGSKVTLFNGSSIESLVSVPENIVGIRSQCLVCDEGGKISRQMYALCKPFTALSSDYAVGQGLDTELYPHQLPNQILMISSAEGVNSELYDDFKYCWEQMLLGRSDEFFAASIDYHFPLSPTTHGVSTPPLLSQSTLDNALAANPYKFRREYGNIFDESDSEQTVIRRSTIRKNSESFYPITSNTTNSKYIIAYDPASKVDRSSIVVAELFRHPKRGLCAKLVNCIDLYKTLADGKKIPLQQPEQIKRLKEIIAAYNGPTSDYENISRIYIDGGSGGGGFQISQYLLDGWELNGRLHRGIIDKEDPYQGLIADEHPEAVDILTLVNFVRSKTEYYDAVENMINQGLIIFPESPTSRGELEFEEETADGDITIRREKLGIDDLEILLNFDIAKEELTGMEKIKKENGSIQYKQSPEAVSRNLHDDKADCIAFICYHLARLRALEVLDTQAPVNDLSSLYNIRTSPIKPKPKKKPFDYSKGNPFRGTKPGGFIKY